MDKEKKCENCLFFGCTWYCDWIEVWIKKGFCESFKYDGDKNVCFKKEI